MENPCKDIDPYFDNFGYNTEEGCDICGKHPAKVEPRFGYISCQNHAWLNPVRFSELSKHNRYVDWTANDQNKSSSS